MTQQISRILQAILCFLSLNTPTLYPDPKTKTFISINALNSIRTKYLEVLDTAYIAKNLRVGGKTVLMGDLEVRGNITSLNPIGGSGIITGPGSSTLNAVPRFANNSGTTLANSSVLIDDSGNITLNGITKDSVTVNWPSALGAAGTFLGSDGAGNLVYSTPAGAGDVSATSPFSITNAILRTDLANGTRNIQESGATIDDTGNMSVSGQLNILTQHPLRLQDNSGGEYIGLVAPATVPSSYTLTLPSATPTANQFLRANSATPTTLEWVTGSGAVTPSAGKTIYVTKFGSDITGDGSFTSPYASLKQAASTANSISTTSNPITISISSGIYTEDNSTGPIAFTAGGISVIGASASGVFIYPNTLSQNLISTTAGVRFVNITFDANGVSTATGLDFSGTANTSNGNNLRVFNFQTGMNCAGTFGAYLFDECTFRTNGTGIICNNSTVILNNSTISGSLTNTPANTGMTITGAAGIVFFTGGLCSRLVNAITADTNAQLVLHSTIFRRCTQDIIAATAAQAQIMSASFQINNTGGIDIQADGAGTIIDLIGCFFNGKDGSGVAQGTGIKSTDGAAITIAGSEIQSFITAVQVGAVSDTSSTSVTLSGTSILNCTTDITQNGTTTLNFNSGTASSSKISINDPTNVKLAYFDPADDNTLKIGSLTNTTEISLIRALIAQTNSPRINYLSDLYSTQAIGLRNPQNSDSSWYAVSDTGNNINLTGVTTNRAKAATVRLVSDTAGTVGGTTALRGWDISKKATSAELSFNYQNSDTTGQAAVADHTVAQLDGVNNQLQLPTAGTQIVFTIDTNLYRSAADTLKTDDNLIIGGLTASRAVATDGSKQLVSSAATATELGYLSGVTSAIQDQLNTKLSTTGGTLTGTLQLPAGSTANPSLVFTGSTTTGLSATSDNLSISTGGSERFKVSSAGTVSINGFTSSGVVHNDASGNLSSSLIVNGDIDNAANISDTKLATISTAGKVANSATTATSNNTASAIVARDASGNFTAGTITANLTGTVTGSASLNVLKAGDTMTGALTIPAGSAASPTLKFSGSTNTGLSAQTANTLVLSTNSTERMSISPAGAVAIAALASTGVVHSTTGTGELTTSLIVNNDITDATISNAKLATISSSNTSGNIVVRDGSGNFAANMISLTGTVTNNTDAATKAYVDAAVATGITAKTPALVVSATNITLSGTQTIDGVALVANNRVLLVGQTNPIQNGLWLVQAGAWTRPTDFAAGSTAGQAYVLITSGNTQAGSSWLCNTPTAIIDTDPIAFAQFSIPGQTTAANVGAGTGQIFRDKTGITLNLKTVAAGTHMTVTNNADDITLATDATNNNTASTLVARDGSGDFSAGTITAALIGAASLNVLKSGDSMTGTLNMLTQNAVRFQDAAGGEYIGLIAPTTVTSSYTLTLPSATPTANQFLRANSATPTTLEWVTGSGAVTPSAGKTIYVTKFGSDVTGDGSFTSPYASLKQAASTANSISTTSNPITILISSGVYTEDNSAGPIAFTADGISVVGASASGVFIYPNTLSQNLISTTVGVRFVNITFDANGVSTATGLDFSGTANTSNGNNLRVFNFQTGMNCGGTFGNYLFDQCTFRTNGTGVACSNTAIFNDCVVSGSLTNTPANTGISITSSTGIVFFTGGLFSRLVTAITANTNAQLIVQATIFRRNTNDVIAASATRAQIIGASMQINNSGGVDVQADGAGTLVDIIGCYFNGKDGSGVAQGTAIISTGGAAVSVTGSEIEFFITGAQAGNVSDTSSTSLELSNTSISSSTTTDIIQNGTSTLNCNAGSASGSKISINNSTNVKLSFFNIEQNNSLHIGNFSNTSTDLIDAVISNGSNHPQLSYNPNIYTYRSFVFSNPTTQNALISQSPSIAAIMGITTNRATEVVARLVSDTGSPVGVNNVRGWNLIKEGNSASLIFSYENSDPVGQAVISEHPVIQLDGVNNQLQLPTAGTQIVFTSDTNLYRSAADTLKTDDNLIIGGLTASRAVATDGSKQLVSSSATATELGYLSGVTSAIQDQLNTKLSTTGGTLTGALQLPAGTTANPALVFTGSTTTGLSASSDNLSISTGGSERLKVSSAGTVSINGFTSSGVVHNDASGNLSSSLIVNGDIDNAANISDTKLATISSAGKVANSATTATNANIANAIVARDASGNFTAGTITANLTGTVTGSASLNVLKAGDTMTGALTLPAGSAASPSLKFSGSTNTGISAQNSNTISLDTNGVERMLIGAGGLITINGLNSTGLVHTDSNGVLSTSLLVNADVSPSAAIVDTKLATISTAGKVSNSATTATSSNTASAIVARDGSGNFSAGTITASLTAPAGSAAAPSIQFTGSTNTGFSAATANILSFDTNGTERMSISTTDITLQTRTLFSTITCNQAIQTATPTNNSTVTTNSTTGVLIFQHPANRTNVTINFPPSPTNGQLFTMLLGTTNSITLNLAGGTGGASIVNGITTLNTNAPGASTGGPTATYIYLSSANTWYLYAR